MNPFEACLKKKPFKSEQDALNAVELARIFDWKELRVYQCPRCHYWHRTKKVLSDVN